VGVTRRPNPAYRAYLDWLATQPAAEEDTSTQPIYSDGGGVSKPEVETIDKKVTEAVKKKVIDVESGVVSYVTEYVTKIVKVPMPVDTPHRSNLALSAPEISPHAVAVILHSPAST
jgi:hypothetical protein